MKNIKTITVLFAFMLTKSLSGQDVSFSQFYSNPLYLNPAFAGSIEVPRIGLQYRNQWHTFSNAYTTYSAAFDMPVKKLRGGLGLHFLSDTQGSGILKALEANISCSVFIPLSENYRFHGGLQAGYHQNSLSVNELVFPDNLDPNFGHHGVSGELANLRDPKYIYPDFSAGILIFSKKIFFGLAAHHLNEPNQSFYSGQDEVSILNRKFTAHFGARLPVYNHGQWRKKFDVSPNLIIQQQGNFKQINYGMYATKRGLTGGVWFRQNFGLRYDSVILLIGFLKRNWQLTYSYDWTVSGLWGDTGGTSEISLSFLLKEIKNKTYLPFYNQYEEEFGIQ